MSSNAKYTNHLISEAKQGRKNLFIELSLHFLPRIYSIVFGLVPNIEAAKKICAEVFFIIWKRINSIETDSDFVIQLKEIAIIRSFIYLRDVENIELDDLALKELSKGDEKFFTPVEKEFLKLTYIQRIVLILNDKLGISTKQITEILKKSDEDEVREELHSAREILIKKFPSEKLSDFPEHGWAILNDCMLKLDKGISKYLEDEVFELISDYLQQNKALLDGLFDHITPDEQFSVFLKEYLLKDSSDKAIKNDLVEFSNNYSSVSTKQATSSFEKEFSSTDSTISNIKEYLGAIIPAKRTWSWFAFIVVFILIASSAYFYLNATDNSWIVKKGSGIFILNGNQNQIAELTDGANISTIGNSKVEIISNKNSNIMLLAKSNLRLNTIEKNLAIFSILEGSILVEHGSNKNQNDFSEKDIIIIEANGVDVISHQGKLLVNYSKKNELDVEVESGFAEVRLEKTTYYLSKNYKFFKKQNNKHIIPFNKNSNYEFLELIRTVNPQNVDKLTIMEIIKNSSKDDYLTLFNLLLISDVSNRILLLNKLNEFFPLKTLFVWDNLVNLEKNEINFFRNFLINNY